MWGLYLHVFSLFMASRFTLASSSLCPPLRNTTPGTAAGTVRCSARTVSLAISAVLAGFASMPASQQSVRSLHAHMMDYLCSAQSYDLVCRPLLVIGAAL